MKRFLCLVLLAALLLTLLTACKGETPDGGEQKAGEPSLIILPDNVNYISIHLYSETEGGSAYFDKNNYGAMLQLIDELRLSSVIALPDTDPDTFLFDDCFDINVYGADGTLMQISVDKNGLICINTEFFTLSEGLLSYKRVQSYFEEFRE